MTAHPPHPLPGSFIREAPEWMDEVLLFSSTVSQDVVKIRISKNYVAEVFERSFKNAVKNWYKPGFRKGKPPSALYPEIRKQLLPRLLNSIALNAFHHLQPFLPYSPLIPLPRFSSHPLSAELFFSSNVVQKPSEKEWKKKKKKGKIAEENLKWEEGEDFVFYAGYLTQPKVPNPLLTQFPGGRKIKIRHFYTPDPDEMNFLFPVRETGGENLEKSLPSIQSPAPGLEYNIGGGNDERK